MGDRVLFQVVGKDGEISPVIYGHWAGARVHQIAKAIRARMVGREGDVQYTAARLVQEVIDGDKGNVSYGIWNATHRLGARDSHGDAGVVLCHVKPDAPMRFQCLGGYLEVGPDGLPRERTDAR